MTEARRRYGLLAAAVAGALMLAIAVAALIEYVGNAHLVSLYTSDDASTITAVTPSGALDRDSATMTLHEAPRPLPGIRFRDGESQPLTLADFQGKIVLLNIWATWCGPCRDEMPTLDQLQAELGGPAFQVVALSIDRAGLGVVAGFYDEIGIEHLAKYIDESGKAARDVKAVGLPTTLLIDREGREIARHVGPAEWDTPEMVAFFQGQLGRKSGALWPEPAGNEAHARAKDPAARSAPHRTLRAAHLPAPGHAASSAITKGYSS